MEITYYGKNCFRMMERGAAAIVTDPYGEATIESPPRLRGDIVTISLDAPGYNGVDALSGTDYIVFNTPGEYEVSEIFITGLATHDPQADPETTHRNIIYLYDFGNVMVCHLGNLDYIPESTTIEALGQLDVLLVPIGGNGTLSTAQAAEVISMIEPGIAIPMHYGLEGVDYDADSLDRFLKEMGATDDLEIQSSLRVSSRTVSADDSTQVVVLERKE